jgi:signal transduction histidine kinase
MKSLPIRVRLTLWYFAMFASAAMLLSFASFLMLQQSLDKIEYHDLEERADDVRQILNREDEDKSIKQPGDKLAAVYDLKDDGKYLQIRDERGNWVYRSKRMIVQNYDLPAPDKLPKAGLIVDFHKGKHRVRTLVYPIVARGVRYSVQTGAAMDKSRAMLNTFRLDLLLLTPAVILLAAVGGHLMSRKALMPVAVLAAETRRINDRNLNTRLPVSTAKDEISDLSRTLNQMLERIDRAFTSVRTFTGNASHELRTPISLLRTEIEVALFRPREAGEYRAILSRLHEETVRMTSLVENLLSLARADGGAETMALAPFRVDVFFHQLATTWKGAMDRAMLDFRVEMPDSDLLLLCDIQGISRLLSILLENASKYTPPGGSVTLRATVAGRRADISVHDTGIGIDPVHRVRIFERFFRIPNAGSGSAGSGLGLSLAKWIAERHGTQLRVESAPGRGSCFFFSLERADTALQAIHDSPLADAKFLR